MLTDERIKWMNRIDTMDAETMLKFYRFVPAGHPVFVDSELNAYFRTRATMLQAFTPEISKKVGWEPPSPEEIRLLSQLS